MNETEGRDQALVNTLEAAKRLGVSASTMVNWRRRKYGPPFVMVSRLVRYRVDEMMMGLCVGGADQAGQRGDANRIAERAPGRLDLPRLSVEETEGDCR